MDKLVSKKFITASVGTLFTMTVACIALFTGKLTAEQWTGFNQWLWPMVLGVYSAADLVDKKVEKKVAKKDG
jgi:hypothetical protein